MHKRVAENPPYRCKQVLFVNCYVVFVQFLKMLLCNHLVIIVQSIPDQAIQCPIYTGPGHIVSNIYRTRPYSVQEHTGPTKPYSVQYIPDQTIQCSSAYRTKPNIVQVHYRTKPQSVQSIPDQAIQCSIYTGPGHIVFKCIPDQTIQGSSAYRTNPYSVQSIPDQAI